MSTEQATTPSEPRGGQSADESAESPVTDETDLSGQMLSGRYRLEGCLGVGGMGSVYCAEHTLMKKTVAIKVLHADVVGSREAVERFRREAQAAAHIDHQNVCVATDFGELDGGGFFLVMEYLEGNTLDETLVCADRFEPRRAIHVIDQILAALDGAHRLGVVHRDLKPENVMLVQRGGDPDFVKIMDFGVARVRIGDSPDDARLTQAGRVYGTPMYMSPEQAAGAENIDERADLYSVGVMLFEMLTGRLPFVDENPARIMAMHMTEKPPSVRQRLPRAGIPKRLDQLVKRLMAKEPDRRPSSAQEVREELSAIEQLGSTQSWMARTRQAAGTSSLAIRQTADKIRPHLQDLRQWLGRHTVARRLVIAAVVGLVAVSVVGAISYIGGADGQLAGVEQRQKVADILADERTETLDDFDAEAVLNTLATGDARQAVDRLDGLIADHRDNAHLRFLLGRAHAIVGNWQAALEQYRRALDLDARYANETRLIDDVVSRYQGGADAQVDLAESILVDDVPAAVGNRRLSAIARMGDRGGARDRAHDALEANDRLSSLEAWNRASIQLRFAHGCQEHAAAIDAIVAAGDPRGLEILRYYDRQPKSGCGTFDQVDCYGCIRDELSRAISTLENHAVDHHPPEQTQTASSPRSR